MIRPALEFGEIVRVRRKALGLTQAELATRIGSGERFVVDLESGKPSCHLEKSLLAAVEVGVDLRVGSDTDFENDDGTLANLPRF